MNEKLLIYAVAKVFKKVKKIKQVTARDDILGCCG